MLKVFPCGSVVTELGGGGKDTITIAFLESQPFIPIIFKVAHVSAPLRKTRCDPEIHAQGVPISWRRQSHINEEIKFNFESGYSSRRDGSSERS